MRILFIITLLFSLELNAQKKPVKKDPPPSQKEMNEMMKEMEDAFNNMSPEEKRFMDSMGIKMPNGKQMKKTADFAMANSSVQPDVLVPKRDAVRIASISKLPLTKTALPAYLRAVYQKITQQLPAELQQKITTQYREISTQQTGKTNKSLVASSYFSLGNLNAALLLMVEASLENPNDANILNNLAALLNMAGGEHLALPILQLLNQQYPSNSTILNNIAHAWFGLGDVNNATKYIDSTIRLCAWHPQANQIKAAIEESKGNRDAAVKSLKQSVSRMHTPEKENALNKLGYELKSNDIIWGAPNAPDQLGLSKFIWPGFSKSLDDCEINQQAWANFRNECNSLIAKLNAENEILHTIIQEQMVKKSKMGANSTSNGGSAFFIIASPKIVKKLWPNVERLMDLEAKDPTGLAFIRLSDTVEMYKRRADAEIGEINKNIKPGSEGTGINPAYCEAINNVQENLIRNVNTLIETTAVKYRDRAKQRITELIHYKMYFESPEQFALSVNLAKIEWLGMLIASSGGICPLKCDAVETQRQETVKLLAEFDDINCTNISRFTLGLSYIETACGRTTVKINVPNIKSEWEFRSADKEENRNPWDEFRRCTIEVSAGYSKAIGSGPLQLQAEAEVTGILEFDRTGLKDAVIKADVGIGVTTNVVDNKVETNVGKVGIGPSDKSMTFGGVNATISINSGFTATGSGILTGVKF